VASDILRTASRLTVAPNRFFPFTPFTAPNPMPNTGVHRFIYALYTQPSRFDNIGFESVGMEAATQNWNVSWAPSAASIATLSLSLSPLTMLQLSRWRTQLGLGPAIGATFFTIDTDANGGQGASSNGSSVPGGTSAAPSTSASLFATGFTLAATVLGMMTIF
jgi:hypothetical protein